MGNFVHGLAHPVSGADHILAMVAVGLWGAVAGGRALWAWPAAFVAMVVAGFASAILGMRLATYATGFSLATAALHILGLGAGLTLVRSARESLLRTTGGGVALGGLALIATSA